MSVIDKVGNGPSCSLFSNKGWLDLTKLDLLEFVKQVELEQVYFFRLHKWVEF